jgi:hypothetical protein
MKNEFGGTCSTHVGENNSTILSENLSSMEVGVITKSVLKH